MRSILYSILRYILLIVVYSHMLKVYKERPPPQYTSEL